MRQMREWKFKGQRGHFTVHKRRGTIALEDMGLPNLSGAVTQLAWEKDINLAAGDPPQDLSPRSPRQGSSQGQGQGAGQGQVANGGPRLLNGSAVQQQDHHHNVVSTPTRRPRILEYNRVAPLLPPLPQEESTFLTLTRPHEGQMAVDREIRDGLRKREKPAPAKSSNVMTLDLKSISSWGGDTTEQSVSEDTPHPPLSPTKEPGVGGFRDAEAGRQSPGKERKMIRTAVQDIEAGRVSPSKQSFSSVTFKDVESGVGVETTHTQSETPSGTPERSRRHKKKKVKGGKHSRESTPKRSPDTALSRSPSRDLDSIGKDSQHGDLRGQPGLDSPVSRGEPDQDSTDV